MLCYAMLCYVMLSYVMYVMICCVMYGWGNWAPDAGGTRGNPAGRGLGAGWGNPAGPLIAPYIKILYKNPLEIPKGIPS